MKNLVQKIFDKLMDEPKWREMMSKHGVTPTSSLIDDVFIVDRTCQGFEDFSTAQAKLIDPGDPASSLFYHSMASHRVVLEGLKEDTYPSLQEVDLVENYIYSLKEIAEQELINLIPAVFAYEYRSAYGVPHQKHADLVFSRTGIGRVGNAPAKYLKKSRCWEHEAFAAHEVRVLPVRFGLFLAKRVGGAEAQAGIYGGLKSGDEDRAFLMPITKLFTGRRLNAESKVDIELLWDTFHITDRVKRMFTIGELPIAESVDINSPPFVRSTKNGGLRINVSAYEGSLVVESSAAPLVQEAFVSAGNTTGKVTPLSSNVPKKSPEIVGYSPNRRYSTLRLGQARLIAGIDYVLSEIRTSISNDRVYLSPRNCPEFSNIRHRINLENGLVEDLNLSIKNEDAFLQVLENGEYDFVLYHDQIADGYVKVQVKGIKGIDATLPAFSILTAPDFFPYVRTMELSEFKDHFKEGGPEPLSSGRLLANQRLRDPISEANIFAEDETMTSVLSLPACTGVLPTFTLINVHENRRTSSLPDNASNVFAPGWDVTYGRDSIYSSAFYHTAGLGSPFLEDAKLCAAANGMWPAASPDASRTFHSRKTPTAVPLTDEELGFYPHSPAVLAGAYSERGWDGEYGPFFQNYEENWGVNYSNIYRADYVSNAIRGLIRFDKLRKITGPEMQRRMRCLAKATDALDGSKVKETTYWLVVFRIITNFSTNLDWPIVPPDMPNRVNFSNKFPEGSEGYLFGFVTNTRESIVTEDPCRVFEPINEPPIFIAVLGDGTLVVKL